MTIQRKNPYGPLDPNTLLAFEKSLRPLRLPDDLRDFLIELNGAQFEDCPNFDEIPGGTALADVFGLHHGPEYLRLDHAWSELQHLVPPQLLVFAADDFGNYFAISLGGQERGAIYFVDHECSPSSLASLPRVATSFSELLHRAGADLAPPQAHPDIAHAVKAGDREAVARFLTRGVSAAGHMHDAVHRGDPAILRTLLDAGGSPDERGGFGDSETPLFIAARTGRADLAALLIERGADPNIRCSAGGTALEMAAPYPRVAAVLVRAGAEPTTPHLREMVRRLRASE